MKHKTYDDRPTRKAKRANRPNPRAERPTQHDSNVVPIHSFTSKQITLIPRSIAQEGYIDFLQDESMDIIFATGPAGCGKTYLAVLYAIQQYRLGNIKKIVVTRPLIANGENIGALPGDLMQKLAPWCVPVLDIFKKFYSVAQVAKMLEEETLELASLGLMRGRTFEEAVVIGDEMQNATPDQLKMMLTRIGQDSKMIITGDVDQHDRGLEKNGLKDMIPRLRRSMPEHMALVTFSQNDIERHRVIGSVLDLYKDA